MTDAEVKQLISVHPDRGDLPIALVQAICLVESSNNEWAMRYEPAYKYLVGVPEQLTATERTGQMISWGLTQVMGAVAREYGFTKDLPMLCMPYVGLRYGMKHLQRYYAKYLNWPDAIAAYNAGSPRKNGTGTYYNQTYVDKVSKTWADYEVHALNPTAI